MYEMNWSLLKGMIQLQPMPQEEIIIGDIVQFMVFLGKVMVTVDDILTRDNIITYKCRFSTMNDKIIYANRESLSKTKIVKIYCNDCNQKSETLFHYLGNECNLCNSYNNNII
jgi:Zn finger protein HypA/HybF involved in hydrogenase expression